MKIKNSSPLIFIFLMSLLVQSCQKYLEIKPEANLQVPQNLDDLQAILDYADNMNRSASYALEAGSDDYYLPDSRWDALPFESNKNIYIWSRNGFSDDRFPGQWLRTYTPIFRANLVFETLKNIPRTTDNATAWDHIKGSAYFFRARGLFEAALIWAKVYNPSTAATDYGIPIRLSSDFNEPTTRAIMESTFSQIVSDLKNAIELLNELPSHVYRPSKAGAYGMLARTAMYMGNYNEALQYADACLNLKNNLIDYNEISGTPAYPFPLFNEEVIFNSNIPASSMFTNGRIDSVLLSSYDSSDLRKTLFFKTFSASSGGGIGFRGNYTASTMLFNGIATDEIYLIRAECYARSGNIEKAIFDLNFLLSKRYKNNSYQPYTSNSNEEVLLKILTERRKELLFRGIRWGDLKRLNREAKFAKTIKRILKGEIYELPANDGRYALSIPNEVIQLTGIPQNE